MYVASVSMCLCEYTHICVLNVYMCVFVYEHVCVRVCVLWLELALLAFNLHHC